MYRLNCDNGFSCKDTEHRTAFQQMMSDAREGLISRINVKKSDRFSRNLRDYLNVGEEFDKFGVSVYSLSEPFNTSSKEGGIMISKTQILLVTLETDSAERFVLRECTIRRKTADDDAQTIEMADSAAEVLWADICSMLPEPPEADTQPYRNTAVMKDGSKLRLPREALEQRLVQAWDETMLHLEMIKRSFQAPNLMGLVAFDPTPKGNPQTPVNTLFGMGMLHNLPPAQKPAETDISRSVRIDSKTWRCGCGAANQHGKFCTECGYPAPPPQPEPWDCPSCGARALTSKFCPECGSPHGKE